MILLLTGIFCHDFMLQRCAHPSNQCSFVQNDNERETERNGVRENVRIENKEREREIVRVL